MLHAQRIILVLHNRILREGIRVLLNSCEDFDLAAVADTIDDLKCLVTSVRPDLVLMDLDLPAGNALDGIMQIQDLQPGAWIIGLAIHDEEEHCVRAIAEGVDTVIAKDMIGKVLVRLVRAGRPSRDEFYERPNVVELAGPVPPDSRGVQSPNPLSPVASESGEPKCTTLAVESATRRR